MIRFGRRRDALDESEHRDLVGDCEAFLAGRLAERLEARRTAVPIWVWTNLLAHGHPSELSEESHRDIPSGPTLYRAWRRARAYLAGEVLALADVDGSIELVQEQVLQPVEFYLADSRAAVLWQANRWATHVSSVLAVFRDQRQMHSSLNGDAKEGRFRYGSQTP
jgi:hypothetical protein